MPIDFKLIRSWPAEAPGGSAMLTRRMATATEATPNALAIQLSGIVLCSTIIAIYLRSDVSAPGVINTATLGRVRSRDRQMPLYTLAGKVMNMWPSFTRAGRHRLAHRVGVTHRPAYRAAPPEGRRWGWQTRAAVQAVSCV